MPLRCSRFSLSAASLLFGGALSLRPAHAQGNPTWLGRPFVKIVQTGDSIPGKEGAVFNNLTHFTLRDGTIHFIGGEGSNTKGLFRWRNGTLSKLVYTDTPAGTGNNFDTVHFTTDETEGALNFVGEVFYGRPGFVYGLFEWRDGIITRVLDTTTPADGKSLAGFGYPVRVGHETVFNSLFFENGAMKTGIFRWDGSSLRTVIQSGDDLPGSLGVFTGQPGQYQIAFDGERVGFIASDHPQGRGPTGVYLASGNGTVNKLADGNDPAPSGESYAQLGMTFSSIALDGEFQFFATIGGVSAAGGNRFYDTSSFRWTGQSNEEVLIQGILDGRILRNIEVVDGQGDDVAFLLKFTDNTLALYAAIGPVAPPEILLLAGATFDGSRVQFEFPSVVGKTYRVEFRAALGGGEWTSRADFNGTGTSLVFSEDSAGDAGFYRVRSLPNGQ